MKTKDIFSIISGGLTTFLIWRILIVFIEPVNFLEGFPCSIMGGYVAGWLKASIFPSGAASGLFAGIILMFYMGMSYGDWPRSVTGGIIMATLWIIGGVLGDLIAIMRKK